ncbi:uncharacterized protein LOC124092960 [Marmota monax]|uniref:uncharacterized protein LOC124092960 n=1 Tax=Marmota monax TaxID=9995 RepID=UPI001EB085D6|nr:uncharacterized protein LOC124092960 [Marmota monax]
MVAWLRTHAATSPVTSRDLVKRCLRPPRRIFLQEPVRTHGPKTPPPSPMEARSLHGAQEASASGSSWSLVTDGLCRSEPTLRSPGSRSSPRRTKWTVRPTPQSLREELSPDLEQDASGHRRGRPRLLYVTAVWFVGVQAHPHPSSGEPFLIQARSTQGGLPLVPLSARGLDLEVQRRSSQWSRSIWKTESPSIGGSLAVFCRWQLSPEEGWPPPRPPSRSVPRSAPGPGLWTAGRTAFPKGERPAGLPSLTHRPAEVMLRRPRASHLRVAGTVEPRVAVPGAVSAGVAGWAQGEPGDCSAGGQRPHAGSRSEQPVSQGRGHSPLEKDSVPISLCSLLGGSLMR